MRIEINEPGSEAFYKEAVSIASQYKHLVNKPQKKLKDMFKSFRNNIIAAAVVLAVLIVELILWGFDTLNVVLAFIMIVLIVVNAIFLNNMKSVVKNMLIEHKSVFTIDEEGVEVFKANSQTVRLAWDKISYVRCFNESVSFIPKSVPGFVMSITKEYKDQIYAYLKEIGKDDLIVDVQ